MRINIHAGHNPDGKIASGAVGIVKESTECRLIKNAVIELLKKQGHTVYDCTVEDGKSQNDVLKKIVAKCNAHTVDMDISIHLNAGASDFAGNRKTTGTEVYIYNQNSKAKDTAQRIVREISRLGFRLRDDSVKDDIKTSGSLYVLKHTKAPSLLIECFFCDDADDAALYRKYGANGIAEAIVRGITGQSAASDNASVIAAGQQHSIKFTGVKIAVDGIAGKETKKAKVRVLQRAINKDYKSSLTEDGILGAKTKAALGCHYVEKGDCQYMVTAAEILLALSGIDPGGVEYPGQYGNRLAASAGKKFGGSGLKISASDFLILVS